jgi:hypothetical protein
MRVAVCTNPAVLCTTHTAQRNRALSVPFFLIFFINSRSAAVAVDRRGWRLVLDRNTSGFLGRRHAAATSEIRIQISGRYFAEGSSAGKPSRTTALRLFF